MALAFSKMHGIGNDFVVLDGRQHPLTLDTSAIRKLGDRHFGVGFDQLLTIESSEDEDCAFRYGIWNRDGTRSGQCGNGVRCVAAWLARDGSLEPGLVRLMSPSGPVRVEVLADARVRVDMGEPRFAPSALPLEASVECNRYSIDVAGRTLEIGAVSMGNPHAVIVVEDVSAAEVEAIGPQLEHATAFPLGCNVGFAQIHSRSAIALRVWERGVGETLACGTGACAAMVVMHRRGEVDDEVEIRLPGGVLMIQWQGPGHSLWMNGPATFVLKGYGMSDLSVRDGLTAMEVASYLRRHSDFLKEFPDIAMLLRLPREQGPAASLASYQLEVLRDKNNEFSRRLHDLIEIAHENETLMVRVHTLTLALMRANGLADTVTRVVASLTEDFHTDLVRVVLFRSDPELPAAEWLLVEADGRDSMPAFAEFLKRGEPLCGRLQQDKLDALFGKRASEVQSAVLLSIGEVGMLAIGSLDANRFHPGMGTVFLRLIAEALSAAVGRYTDNQ